MSIESRCTIGAIASKKASASSPVSARIASASAGEVSGPVAMIDAVPVVRRQAGDFAALDANQRLGGDRRLDRGGKAVAVDRQRAAGRHLMRVGRAHDQRAERAHLAVDDADRVVFSASSERKELEQTSSARRSVRCASVPRSGRISCRTTGTPARAICQAASQPARPPPMT